MKPLPDQIEITVTEEDIREGIPAEACYCAFARAATRAFKQATGEDYRVSVAHDIAVNPLGCWSGDRYAMLPEITSFLNIFDSGFAYLAEPFSCIITKKP